jgi:hypothetical protein
MHIWKRVGGDQPVQFHIGQICAVSMMVKIKFLTLFILKTLGTNYVPGAEVMKIRFIPYL